MGQMELGFRETADSGTYMPLQLSVRDNVRTLLFGNCH